MISWFVCRNLLCSSSFPQCCVRSTRRRGRLSSLITALETMTISLDPLLHHHLLGDTDIPAPDLDIVTTIITTDLTMPLLLPHHHHLLLHLPSPWGSLMVMLRTRTAPVSPLRGQLQQLCRPSEEDMLPVDASLPIMLGSSMRLREDHPSHTISHKKIYTTYHALLLHCLYYRTVNKYTVNCTLELTVYRQCSCQFDSGA